MSKYDYDSAIPFSAFITNLEAYNDGELKGEWVSFPTTPEEFSAAMERIGGEEKFISDYDNYTDLPIHNLGEYENPSALNYLASIIDKMDEHDYKTLCAAVEYEGATDLDEIINCALNVEEGNYILSEDIESDRDLGVKVLEDVADLTVQEANLETYIDYEELGRDVANDTMDNEDVDNMTTEDFVALGEEIAYSAKVSDIENYMDVDEIGRDYSTDENITSEGLLENLDTEQLYDGEVPEDAKVTRDIEDVDSGTDAWEESVD